MSKKKSPTRIDPINLPRRLREGLAEADTLLSEKQPQQALALLHELNVKFPRQIDVLGLMADACLELGDTRGYLRALHPLQALLPHQADIKFALAYAYLENGHLGLSLRTFRQCIKHWPHDPRVEDVQKIIPELESELTKILAEIDFSLEDGLEFLPA